MGGKRKKKKKYSFHFILSAAKKSLLSWNSHIHELYEYISRATRWIMTEFAVDKRDDRDTEIEREKDRIGLIDEYEGWRLCDSIWIPTLSTFRPLFALYLDHSLPRRDYYNHHVFKVMTIRLQQTVYEHPFILEYKFNRSVLSKRRKRYISSRDFISPLLSLTG